MEFVSLLIFLLHSSMTESFGDQRVEETGSGDYMKDENFSYDDPYNGRSGGIGIETKKKVADVSLRNCEGLSSEEYCICTKCHPVIEEECIHKCQSDIKSKIDRQPLGHFHALIGKVLNQSECWMCSHVPQGHHSAGLVPLPLNSSELLGLKEGRPTEGEYNATRSPSLRLRQYTADKSFICLNVTSRKTVGYWEIVWYNLTMAYTVRPDRKNIIPSQVEMVKRNKGYRTFGWWVKPNQVRVGEVNVKSCAMIIQADTCFEQMKTLGKGDFMKTLCNTLVIHTIPYVLPEDVYYICGRKAYKWLAPNPQGLCYLGRVVPEVMAVSHETMMDIHKNNPPPYIHTHYEHREKRALGGDSKQPATNLISESEGYQFLVQLDFTRTARGTLNFNYIQALARLIDNITNMYDETFRYTGLELQAYKKELVQHRMVLNYLTAITGGYCITLSTQFGVKCCTYITNNTDDPQEVINHKMDEILQLKWEFRRTHNVSLSTVGEEIVGWVSWLNPANWFSGFGNWVKELVSSIGKFLFLVIVVIIVVAVSVKCVLTVVRCSRRSNTVVMNLNKVIGVTNNDLYYDPEIELPRVMV